MVVVVIVAVVVVIGGIPPPEMTTKVLQKLFRNPVVYDYRWGQKLQKPCSLRLPFRVRVKTFRSLQRKVESF